MMQKVIPLGDSGKVTLTEDGAAVSIEISANVSAGGGSLAGVATAQLSAKATMSAAQLIDAGLELAMSKYPSASGAIGTLKALVDAEMKGL